MLHRLAALLSDDNAALCRRDLRQHQAAIALGCSDSNGDIRRRADGGLRDPGLLPHTVATCLGLPGQDTGSQADAIVDYLRDRQLLLILDSCEHLIGACAALAEPVLPRLSPAEPSPERPPPPPGPPGP